MKKTNYSPLLRTKLPLGLLVLIALATSCVSNRSVTDAASLPSEARFSTATFTQPSGAAAQSSANLRDLLQGEASDEAELLAANAAVAASGKQAKLKQKLVELRAQLETRTEPSTLAPAKGARKIFLPTKLLVNKLLKKSNRLSEQRVRQINDVEKTQASGNNLVLVGLLLAIIGLLLALLTTETLATIGLVTLVAGLVLAVVGLVG